MINVWGDYEHFASHRIWYLKSFREPGNRLPFITTNATGGIVNFNQPREYHLQYVFSDYYGNKTVKDIYVQGTLQAIPPAQPIGGANALLVNRNNNVAFRSSSVTGKRFAIGTQLFATTTANNSCKCPFGRLSLCSFVASSTCLHSFKDKNNRTNRQYF